MAGGITIGFIVFIITGSFLNQYVLHSDKGYFFPAVVAGVWAAWPLIHSSWVARYNFLHPVAREYKAPAKQVFSKIRHFSSRSTTTTEISGSSRPPTPTPEASSPTSDSQTKRPGTRWILEDSFIHGRRDSRDT